MWNRNHISIVITHLAVTDAVDHLVIFTVESVCQEAQALQENKDVIGPFTAEEERTADACAEKRESPAVSTRSP